MSHQGLKQILKPDLLLLLTSKEFTFIKIQYFKVRNSQAFKKNFHSHQRDASSATALHMFLQLHTLKIHGI